MRLLYLLLLCLSALRPALAALDVSKAPACGLGCMAKSIVTSSCSAENTTCICANELLKAQITECVTASCSIRDQLSMKKFSSENCGVVGQDRRSLVSVIGITFGALGLVAFVLRCLARVIGSHCWGKDDTVICLAMCLEIPLGVLSVPFSHLGLGLDMWFVPFDNITEILRVSLLIPCAQWFPSRLKRKQLYYWDEMIYLTALALTKISVLFFYLKVFPRRSFRICVWVLIAINVVWALSYDFLLIFQCNPIPGAWKHWDGEFEAKCININILGWSAAAINIALDIAIIFLPLPELFSLSMSTKKKVQIMAMFAVGLFTTVVSIVRLYSLIHFGTTSNLTQDYVELGYWSTIEVPVGIICACMPAIRSLFSLVLPQVFGTNRGNTSNYASYGPSNKLGSSGGAIARINVKKEWSVLTDQTHKGEPVNLHSIERE
ncbi:hypothetical protein F4779DRAFT_612785 [Xylariaceae sp. FL0662B]|nr:hypothetical protein F4779DRAFT_612785 [Xylariaceae sp. FL0662B]